jgi:hypothetical protein
MRMLERFLRGRLRKVADSDIFEARSMLSTLKRKLQKEGAQGTLAYGEGVGEVAALLAERFCISVPDALEARGLNWQQLDDASRDLFAALPKVGECSIATFRVFEAQRISRSRGVSCWVIFYISVTLPRPASVSRAASYSYCDDRSTCRVRACHGGARVRDASDAYARASDRG